MHGYLIHNTKSPRVIVCSATGTIAYPTTTLTVSSGGGDFHAKDESSPSTLTVDRVVGDGEHSMHSTSPLAILFYFLVTRGLVL